LGFLQQQLSVLGDGVLFIFHQHSGLHLLC
jgi:hypothetical protein